MPFKSSAQIGKFAELEKQGQLPPGTTKQWAKETPSIKQLPQHVGDKRPGRSRVVAALRR